MERHLRKLPDATRKSLLLYMTFVFVPSTGVLPSLKNPFGEVLFDKKI